MRRRERLSWAIWVAIWWAIWVAIPVPVAATGAAAGRAAVTGAQPGPPAAVLSPAPPDPEVVAGLRRWYDGFAAEVAPLARRWAEVATAGRSGPGRRWAASCRELARALERLDRNAVGSAPDGALRLHLGRMLGRLDGAAAACGRGDYFLASHRLDRAAAAWRQAHHRLLAAGALP